MVKKPGRTWTEGWYRRLVYPASLCARQARLERRLERIEKQLKSAEEKRDRWRRLEWTFVALLLASAALVAIALFWGSRVANTAPFKPIGGVPKEPNGEELIFVVAGDNRPTDKGAPLPPVLSTIFGEVATIHPDLVLWTGDTIYGYCDSKSDLETEYERFFTLAQAAGVSLYNVPGNHEIHPSSDCKGSSEPTGGHCDGNCSLSAFQEQFGGPYSSFDVGGVHFIGLNTEDLEKPGAILGTQLAWLEKDLAEHRGDRAIFVFSHGQFYSSPHLGPSRSQSHRTIGNRVALHELFRNYPVRGVFSGHIHLFWHEPPEDHDQIDYFVAGGAGAPLYATPENGGFSHYLLVRVSGTGRDTKVTYDVIEPGHLSVMPTGKPNEFWLVNSNNADVPMRRIVPPKDLSFVPAGAPSIRAEYKERDGTVKELMITKNDDTAGAVTFKAKPNVPAGRSVLVVANQ
jgi:Calcineurin-like phosphoesterase